MSDKLLFKFTLNDEDKKFAEVHGLPTIYEVRKPQQGYEDKLVVWWDEDEEERSSVYKESIVNEKINSGIWIKL